MDVKITPRPLSGTVEAIPSKSAAHRALICAALADREIKFKLDKRSQDIDATIACLNALGADIRAEGETVSVMPIKSVPKMAALDCNESGSTLRFLLPVAAALCESVSVTGRGRLPERPLSPLMEEMEAHGAVFSGRKLPFTVTKMTRGGKFTLPGDISSQYITGLLLAAPLFAEGAEIKLTTPLQSVGYVDMTIAEMRRFGIAVTADESGFTASGTYKTPENAAVEGDWSNSAFWLAAGAISGKITVSGLDNKSAQGDKEIAQLIKSFGADCAEAENITVSHGELNALAIDVGNIPDLVPVLAVLAAASEGETHIKNAARLKLKESDRIFTTAEMIKSLGGTVKTLDDGLIITGGTLRGGTVKSFGDHRIVMAAATAACVCTDPVTILGAEAADKSYPTFFKDYQSLGGVIDVI